MEIVIRAVIVYFFLWYVTRAAGKKELSQLSAFELILLVTIGDLVQQGVTQEDQSVTGAMLAVGTLTLLMVAFSFTEFRWKRTRRVISGIPVVVVRDGRPVEEVLRLERLDLQELMEGAREQGIGDLSEVRLGVLEPDGRFSFLRADGGRDGGQGGEETLRA